MVSVSQKIKVAVSNLLRSQMELDVEDYGLKSLSDLCNRILARYAEFTPPDPTKMGPDDTLYKNVPSLQFSLNQHGESFANFANSFAKNAGTKIAALCRYYFESYVNMPRGKRECFIFRDSLDKLTSAAEAHANQVRAYVVVCDDCIDAPAATRFHSLRLCHIKGVALETGSEAFHCQKFELSRQAETFREHFDPFLCYGQQVKVKLSEEGAKRYNKLTTNRPKVIAFGGSECAEVNDAGVYIFECSEKLAKVYFPQFLSDADILEPRDLRLWFKEEFEKAAGVYKR